MTFLAPIWLVGLIGWGAVAVWVLLGQRHRAAVPFLELWRGPVRAKPRRRWVELPPAGVVLLLLAGLVGLLAAGRPVVEWGERGIADLTIIYDAGLTMSAPVGGGTRPADSLRESLGRLEGPSPRPSPRVLGEGESHTRGQVLAETVAGELRALLEPERVRVVVVPYGTVIETDEGRWIEEVRGIRPTAVDTGSLVESAVEGVLVKAQAGEVVLVISDRRLEVEDDRVVQVAPEGEMENVGIVHVGARRGPVGQVMVRVRNQSGLERAVLRVESNGEVMEEEVELPGRGAEADVFLDVPVLGRVIEARLMVEDDLPVDDAGWVVLSRPWPRVEAVGPLPRGLERMVAVYRRLRPAEAGSAVALIVREVEELGSGVTGVVVGGGESPGAFAAEGAEIDVGAHPVTEHVEWTAVVEGARSVLAAPEGWDMVVRAGDVGVIAVRERPARQVWVGMELSEWSRRADFVVFWTNVFDWLGGGEAGYASQMPAQLGSEWTAVEAGPMRGETEPGLWPGVYRYLDGRLVAVNAPAVWHEAVETGDWRERLAAQEKVLERKYVELSAVLVLLGLVLILLSALSWTRHGVMRARG